MNIERNEFYMRIAETIAQASHAKRAKNGALLEKNGNIIAFGYNGTPAGFNNECEFHNSGGDFITKGEVLHAETNAISKCAKSTASSARATLYTTCAPCFDCAKLIIQAGIIRVYYRNEYRKSDGLELLQAAGIPYQQLP